MVTVVVLASSACSLVVYNDATTPAVCDDDADCPAGEACVDASCAVVDPGSLPAVGTAIDVTGGTVVGPDGVVLEVPAGAVTGKVSITIARTTSTLPRDNIGDGAFYAIEPAITFAISAVLTLPDEQSTAWLSPVEGLTWEALGASDDGRFVLPRTGVVVKAVELP